MPAKGGLIKSLANLHFSQVCLKNTPGPGVNVYSHTTCNQDKEVSRENVVYLGFFGFSSLHPAGNGCPVQGVNS